MSKDDLQKSISLAARVGMELAVAILVGAFLGYLGDRWLGTRPWLMLAGLVLGTFAGFRNLYRVLNEMERTKKDSNGKST